ncbi:hypothetical protein SALBM311S_02636 [Streptomyces alboniger]
MVFVRQLVRDRRRELGLGQRPQQRQAEHEYAAAHAVGLHPPQGRLRLGDDPDQQRLTKPEPLGHALNQPGQLRLVAGPHRPPRQPPALRGSPDDAGPHQRHRTHERYPRAVHGRDPDDQGRPDQDGRQTGHREHGGDESPLTGDEAAATRARYPHGEAPSPGAPSRGATEARGSSQSGGGCGRPA